MAEPSKDRDKAVDEALATFGPYDERKVLNLLWQRAQEAEREETDAKWAAAIGTHPDDCPDCSKLFMCSAHSRISEAFDPRHTSHPWLADIRTDIKTKVEAEREENRKAVCRYCAEDFAGCEMVPVNLPDLGWVHRAKGEPENVLMCAAGHIRNRRTG